MDIYQQFQEDQLQQVIQLYEEEKRLQRTWRRENTVTAWENEQLQAVVYWWFSPYHIEALYIELVTRTEDIALLTRLLQFARSQAQSGEKRLQCLIDAAETHAVTRMFKLGFKKIRTTELPALLIQEVDSGNDLNPSIQSLTSVLANDALRKQHVQLARVNYEVSHLVNPIRNMPLREWEELVYAPDLRLEDSCVYVQNNQVIAYAHIHSGQTQKHVELGWTGATSGHDQKLCQIFEYQLQCLSQKGVVKVEAEVDCTDKWSTIVYQSFPFQAGSCFLTFQLTSKGEQISSTMLQS